MRNDVEEKQNGENSLQENEEKKKKKKKRGRTEEDNEGIHNYNNSKKKKKKNYVHQSANKLDKTEHCKAKGIVGVKPQDRNKEHVNDSDNINCSTSSSENPSSGLGVFEFPWTREGIVSTSEEWDCVEDTFSSSLEDTCFRSRPFKFSDYYCFLSDTNTTTPAPPATMMHFDRGSSKYVFNESDDEHGLATTKLETETETEGLDCIWRSLLDQPLQHG